MEGYQARDMTCHNSQGQPDAQKGNKHVNIIAKNLKGLENLFTLSQKAFLEGFYYNPRIDFNALSEYREGLVVTSACPAGLINSNLVKGNYEKARKAATVYKDIFGEDFYLEMMYHGLDIEAKIIPGIIRLSKELGIKILATEDSHYIKKEDAEFHELVLCISSGRTKKDPNRLKFPYHEFYFKSAEEMYKIFKFIPEAMRNTCEVAEKCDYSDLIFLEDGGPMRLPKVPLPEGYTDAWSYVNDLAREGFKKLGFEGSKEHEDRLNLELSDLKLAWDTKRYDFANYFLMVKDIIDYAKSENIDSGIRGSAYASLVVRCLGISEKIDPVLGKLIWERFLAYEKKVFVGKSDFGIV